MPNGLSLSEQKAYWLLKELYKAHRDKEITREQAKDEKAKIIAAFTLEHSEEEFLSRKALDLQERIKNASKAFKNERTLENADRLYAAFYGLPYEQ